MIPDINLIPKLEKDHTGSKLFYLILGIIVLLLLSFFLWQYFQARVQIATLSNEQTALQQQRDQLKLELDTYNSMNQGSLKQSVEFVELVSYPVSPLIENIQSLQPENSYLRSYSFSAESVDITVDFETLSDIADFISRLSNSPYYMDAQISSISNFELGNTEQNEDSFDVIPRHTADITLLIDSNYLATGGVQ